MNPRRAPAASPAAPDPHEVLDRSERLAQWLIQRAARASPRLLSDRLQEEWLADLAAQRRGLSRLRFAIGCCWATQVIAHEHVAISGAATSSATGRGSLATLAHHDPWLFSRRTTVLFLIVCVHALVIYGLANGLVGRVVDAIRAPTVPVVGTFIDTPRTPDTTRPLPDPDLWHPSVPFPDLPPIESPPDAAPGEDATPTPLGQSLSPSRPIAVTRVLGGPGPGFPDTDPFYPPASKRLGETGSATVRVCVDGNGRLASDPIMARSSGSTRLDEAALKLAKAGSGHYRSTTEDGRPVSYCYPFRIRFELNK
jgi:protein TonB